MAIYRGPGGSGDATTDAASQATVATTKAAEAAASATAAASSASAAATSASNASTSAGNAETSKNEAETAKIAAELAETNAETAQTAAETAQSAAELAETNAETAQTAAETAQTAAELAETNAETAQTAAETAQTAAELAETNAETAETNAANSATAAASSANDAATSYDSFDDRYLGAKATPPTLDNDGDALLTGALYWNTGSNQLFVWSGSAWEEAAFSASGAVTSFNTRTGAVTLNSTDVTNVGALMDSELTSEVSVKALDQGVATTDSPSFTGLTTTANINFGDNDRAIFGAGSDLQIYHNGANSLISADESHSLYIEAGSIFLNKGIDESMITAVGDGAVSLYYDNAEKLATTATGIDVTGAVVSDGLTVDTNTLYVDSTNNRVGIGTSSPTSSKLHIDGGDLRIQDVTPNIYFYSEGAVNNVQINANISDAAQGGIAILENGNTLIQSRTNFTQFFSANTERMRIDSSGNVGIGRTPNYKLDAYLSGTGSPAIASSNDNIVTVLQSVGSSQGNVGTLTSHPLVFLAGNAERMRIDSAGNVGIGTSSPTSKLEVVDNTDIDMNASGTGHLEIDGNGYNFAIALNASGANLYTNSGSRDLIFGTNEIERMRINGSGNVGIGTSSPGSTLTVASDLTYAVDVSRVGAGNTTLRITGGSTAGNDAVLRADIANTTGSTGIYFGDSDTNGIGRIMYEHNGDYMRFYTSSTEKMRIDSSGDLLLNTTVVGVQNAGAIATDSSQGRLYLNTTGSSGILFLNQSFNDTVSRYQVLFYRSEVFVGSITSSSTSTSYNTTSDYRLKENLNVISNGIDRVKQLNPLRFNFIANPEKTVDGFLAHEVDLIVPEAVTGEKDALDEKGNIDPQQIDQSKLVPLLTAALQEAITKIEALEARVATLESN